MKTALALVLGLALTAAACGRGDEEAAGTELARSDAARAAPVAAAVGPAVGAVNGLGLDLYRWLVDAGDGANLVVSPVSIATALAMTRAGAAGTTADELDLVLSVDDPAALHAGMNALDQALDARNGPVLDAGGDEVEVLVSSANSLWAQHDRQYEAAFLDTLATQYGAGLRLVDFEADPESARRAINAWVAGETLDRIPELLAEGSIDQRTRLTLVNAVVLTAPWTHPFEAGRTAPGPFTTVDGSVVDVPRMRLDQQLPYARGEGWQAVELPYAGGELAMLVLVPDPGSLAGVEAGLTASFLDSITAALASRPVALTLPSWDTTSTLGLREALGALGMPTAFTDRADLSGMTTDEPLQIDDVVHEATITVDEAGTEAAAATAVIAGATSAPAEPLALTVDRPFAYALRDRATGAVLFLGRVGNPAEG